MVSPKPYSNTDETEERAKVVLESLLDLHHVKPDIRNRDKVPNVDGEIVLINEAREPTGKFDVQVKSIGKGEMKFDCPTSLVGYSMNSTSLPVLLICVDVESQYAYWKHINSQMPEYKENQKTFTVHFSRESDSIDKSSTYLQKWNSIALKYQERTNSFPAMPLEVVNKFNFQGISSEDLVLFQKYIETINQLFDSDFISVKKMLFPNMWKVGVGIISSDQAHFHYQIFISPWGEPKPLVCKLDKGGLPVSEWAPGTISEVVASREALEDPIKQGKDFVFGHLKSVVERKSLPISGKTIASDVLIAFVDKYGRCLGLAPGLDRYSIQDLDHALNHHFTQMCVAVFGQFIKNGPDTLHIDLDWLSGYLSKTKVTPVNMDSSTYRFLVSSNSFPIDIAFESLGYLMAEQVSFINRPFGNRDLPLSGKKRAWIWSFHSERNQMESVTRILNESICEYSKFVQQNQFRFPRSPYLDPDTSIAFRYEPGKPDGTFSEGPTLEEYHIPNQARHLPKVSIVSNDQKPVFVKEENSYTIRIDGIEYHSSLACYRDASDFFQPAPVLDFVYKMLGLDLSTHYGISTHPRILL